MDRCIVGPCELRLGRWQDALADVETCDAVITDPPYSAKVEKGFRHGGDARDQCGMGYDPIDADWCQAFVCRWHESCASWFVVYSDHVAASWWSASLDASGRYVFPPVPLVKTGAGPRMAGDGPASQAEWITIARPRESRFMGSGSRPGWYSMETVRHGHGYIGVRGAKSLDHMRAIVRDYSRPGDLVVDPCAGGATTLIAAGLEGRRAIGSEMDPATYAKACARLREYEGAFRQATLFERATLEKPKQGGLGL